MCEFVELKDNFKKTVDYVTVSKVVNDEMKNVVIYLKLLFIE